MIMVASTQLTNISNMQDPQSLMTAFEQFGRLSEQLQQSYQDLDRRTAELTEELATARDERLKQLAEKEKLADRLETLLGALPAGVVVINEQGMIQTANAAAESFFEQSLHNKNWQHILKTSIQRTEAQDIILKNGRTLGFSKNKLEADNGEIILINDFTHMRMLQDLADRQNRLAAMGQMAAGLAHQLRTPLSSAVLYASQLEKNLQQDQHSNKAIGKIRTSLRYLEKLINDMLMYAKGGEFIDKSFSLNQLLVSFNARLETRLQQTQTDLKIINKTQGIELNGSMDALVSILINLADNAIQVCDKSCELLLNVYLQNEHLILAVSDNGPGLSDEQQLHVFEPFYSDRDGGTGLGLAVAQAIAQAHHGDLLVKSTLGNGCTFYLCLPLQQGEQFLPSGTITRWAELRR
ncbi:MAG: sensor histidine kinase [Gammaproteobacteria bacterium]